MAQPTLPSPNSTRTAPNVTTNIVLIEIADMVILGEFFAANGPATFTASGSAHVAADFTSLAANAYAVMDALVTRTTAHGIDEFSSASYTSAQLDALTIGARFAATPTDFTRMLAYYWQDIGTNWFAGTGSLGGGHGRNYDFLGGHGPIEQYAYLAGWVPTIPASTNADPDEEFVFAALAASTGGFEPSDAARAHAFAGEKRLSALWNTVAGRDRTSYITGTYALGTSSVDFHAGSSSYDQDATVEAQLAGSGISDLTLAIVDERSDDNPLFTDQSNDNPYGDTKTIQGDFSKTYHLDPRIVTVQLDDVALVTGYTAPDSEEDATPNPTTLTMNVVLPLGAIDIDGTPVAMGALPSTVAVTTGSLVVDRVGDAAVAVRVIQALGCDGATPAPAVVAYELRGQGHHDQPRAFRIADYDNPATPLTSCTAAPFAFAIAVGRCCDPTCSNVRDKLGAGAVGRRPRPARPPRSPSARTRCTSIDPTRSRPRPA